MAYWFFVITVSVIALVCAAGIVRPELLDELIDGALPRLRRRLRDRRIDRIAGELASEGLLVVRTGEARPIERDAGCIELVKEFYSKKK